MASATVPWKLPQPPTHPYWMRFVLWVIFLHWLWLGAYIGWLILA